MKEEHWWKTTFVGSLHAAYSALRHFFIILNPRKRILKFGQNQSVTVDMMMLLLLFNIDVLVVDKKKPSFKNWSK